MNSQRSGEDETPTPPSAPFQPLQMQPPPAQVQAPLRPQLQPTVVSNLAMGQVLDMLLSEAKDAFFVCEELGLQAKRALACTCSALRPVIFQLLRQPRLVTGSEIRCRTFRKKFWGAPQVLLVVHKASKVST